VNKVTIVGATTWGITLAFNVANSKDTAVQILVRDRQELEILQKDRESKRFLPGFTFPDNIQITNDALNSLKSTPVVIIGVPSQKFRQNLSRIQEYWEKGSVLVSATKGIEIPSMKRMSEIVQEILPGDAYNNMCVLSGPNLAKEIMSGKPSSSVVASLSKESAILVQSLLMQPRFRIYTTNDVIGVELAGSLKNILAIGAGIVDGLGLGDNAKAAYITRGVAEITRLGVAMGANPLTFSGLSGIGDIIATCYSKLSRNHSFGERLSTGKSIETIILDMDNIVEGVETTRAAATIGRSLGVNLPIIQTMSEILFGSLDPVIGIQMLMDRPPTSEL
jgi:glycerol-3-phosphate dehydrogenase (NAD(P)+)